MGRYLMPWIPNVVTRTNIATGWGNPLRDSAIMEFANVAERDQYWPAATAPMGAHCRTADTGALWELNLQTGARRWTPTWSVSWGQVGGIGPVVATQTGIGTTLTALTGFAYTFTAIAGRAYRVEAACGFTSAAAADALLSLLENGVQIAGSTIPTTGWTHNTAVSRNRAPGAGSVTYSCSASASTGTIATSVAPTAPGLLTVTDIGPNVRIVP